MLICLFIIYINSEIICLCDIFFIGQTYVKAQTYTNTEKRKKIFLSLVYSNNFCIYARVHYISILYLSYLE